MSTETQPLSPADLRQFTGTETWTRHGLVPKMLMTEGVMHFAEKAGNGAYWFTTIIATEVVPLLAKESFITVKMVVADGAAKITADGGNDNIFWAREIDWTDCPPGEWKFYLIDNSDAIVLLLPSEY